MKKIKNIFKGDPWIWWCFLGLSIISTIFVFSTIGSVSQGHPFAAWLRHMVFVLGAWVVAILVSHVNYRLFAQWSKPFTALSVVLLAVLAFVFKNRWITIGGYQFQPSEIAKIALLISMAKMLTQNKKLLNEPGFFVRLVGMMAVVAGLIVPSNFSTAAIVSIICLLMMFFGGVNLKYWSITVVALVALSGVYLSHKYTVYKAAVESAVETEVDYGGLERSETWSSRVYTWVQDDHEVDDQFNKARMAQARGGFTGVGLGNTVFARFLPESHSDFIFTIIVEEGGMMTGLFVIVIYAILCARCIKMASRCRGTFGTLLLGGLGSYIFVQAIVHISYNVGVIPVTGQTLPLISHGGTSYLMFGFALGIIQSVCFDVRKAERAEKEQLKADQSFAEAVEIANENSPLTTNN